MFVCEVRMRIQGDDGLHAVRGGHGGHGSLVGELQGRGVEVRQCAVCVYVCLSHVLCVVGRRDSPS